MTLKTGSITFLTFALLGFSVPGSASTSDPAEGNIPVQFAILLDRGNPIAGDATCVIGRNCRLLEQEHPRLDLHLKIHRERDYLVSELNVRCEDSCSFSNGRSTTKFFQGTGQFDLFEGEDNPVEIPLVLRPREKIGRILLIYQRSGVRSGNVVDRI